MIKKIVSGGQTGVDRAALDVALALNIACGGWCPQGRRAEDGPLDERYPLKEASTPYYPQRTELNVRDSDATLIIGRGKPSGGTALTLKIVTAHAKGHFIADILDTKSLEKCILWLKKSKPATLNIAGPRESTGQIYDDAFAFLMALMT